MFHWSCPPENTKPFRERLRRSIRTKSKAQKSIKEENKPSVLAITTGTFETVSEQELLHELFGAFTMSYDESSACRLVLAGNTNARGIFDPQRYTRFSAILWTAARRVENTIRYSATVVHNPSAAHPLSVGLLSELRQIYPISRSEETISMAVEPPFLGEFDLF